MRNRIIGLKRDAKYSNHRIAKTLNVTRPTVRSVLRRFQETGLIPGQGRKPKLSKKEVRSVMQKAASEKSSEKIAKQISAKRKSPVSAHTVQRVLKRQRKQYLTKIETEEITLKQKERRLAFAQKRINDNWEGAFYRRKNIRT